MIGYHPGRLCGSEICLDKQFIYEQAASLCLERSLSERSGILIQLTSARVPVESIINTDTVNR